MSKKPKKTDPPPIAETPAQAAAPQPFERNDAVGAVPSSAKRVSFALTESGEIDAERMRGKTRDELRAILGNPKNLEILGISGQGDPGGNLQSSGASGLLDLFGVGEAWLISKIYKVPYSLAAPYFLFDEEEKKALADPMAQVVHKHFPWLDATAGIETQLIGALVMIEKKKFDAFHLRLRAELELASAAEHSAGKPNGAPKESTDQKE